MARRDRERFEREKAAYNGPWKIPDVKDPSAPKKPMSAFLAFGNERRREIAEANPTLNNTEISHVLSKLWRECPPDVRQQYKDREARERAAFKKIRLEWEYQKEQKFIRRNLTASAAKKPPSTSNTHKVNDTSLPLIASSIAGTMMSDDFSSVAHPISTFSSDYQGSNIIQPLRPEASGNFPGFVTTGPYMYHNTCINSATTRSNAVVSEESLDAYLSLDESSTSSENVSGFDPTSLDPPTYQWTMTREPTLLNLEGDRAVKHNDIMEELEILGELEDDDDEYFEEVKKNHADAPPHQHFVQSMHSWQQGSIKNNEASRSNTAIGYCAQETTQWAKLARELGDVGVDMLIGAFR